LNTRAALLGLFVVLTIIFGATTAYESTLRTATSTMVTTVSTIPSAYDQVATAYENHLLNLVAINASNFLGGYEENATVQWKGFSGGCDGNYTGLSEFGPLFGTLTSDQQYVIITNETQSIRPAGDDWAVNSTIYLVTNSTGSKSIVSPFAGVSEMTIAAQDSYVKFDGSWMITTETWNFLHFDNSIVERPGATTCQG
jgi:hypothetical protein